MPQKRHRPVLDDSDEVFSEGRARPCATLASVSWFLERFSPPSESFPCPNRIPVGRQNDMRCDPDETRNLAADSAQASILAEHKKLLSTWQSHLKAAARD